MNLESQAKYVAKTGMSISTKASGIRRNSSLTISVSTSASMTARHLLQTKHSIGCKPNTSRALYLPRRVRFLRRSVSASSTARPIFLIRFAQTSVSQPIRVNALVPLQDRCCQSHTTSLSRKASPCTASTSGVQPIDIRLAKTFLHRGAASSSD